MLIKQTVFPRVRSIAGHTRRFARFLTILVFILLPFAAWTQSISTGDTPDKVVMELGEPTGKLHFGDVEVYVYDRGKVYFKGGKVYSVRLVSVRDAWKQEKEREERERQERLAAQKARAARIRIGTAEKADRLADDQFTSAAPDKQLLYWEQFRKMYPEVDVSKEMQRARKQIDELSKPGEDEQALEDAEARLQDLEKQMAEIDQAYAVSRTHWKRRELKRRRAAIAPQVASTRSKIKELEEKLAEQDGRSSLLPDN